MGRGAGPLYEPGPTQKLARQSLGLPPAKERPRAAGRGEEGEGARSAGSQPRSHGLACSRLA